MDICELVKAVGSCYYDAMLKKIVVYVTEQLLNSEEAGIFFESLQESVDRGDITEFVCEKLDVNRSYKQMDEMLEMCVQKKEEVLFLTDLPYMFLKIKSHNIPVLPIALSMDKMDAFLGAEFLLGGLEGVTFTYLNRIYQRHHNIPWTILETKRTIIREMTVDDVEKLYEIYEEESITKYTDKLFADPEEEKAYTKEYIRTVYRFMEFGMWIIEDKQNRGRVIGRAGFAVRDGYDTPEIGYIVRREEQGKGIATEVCEAILAYGGEQLGFDEVRLIMDEQNEASLHLGKRLGFQFESDVLVDKKPMKQYIKCLNMIDK